MDFVEELRSRGYPVNRQVHDQEHSIENQLPFLVSIQPGVRLVPVGVGAVDLAAASRIAGDIAALVAKCGDEVVLLGTTDFSHEGPAYGGAHMTVEGVTALTRTKDAPLLHAVKCMDAARLLELGKRSSMCGAGAAAVLLLACQTLGWTTSRLLKYNVNTEISPDYSTTGFAAFSFTAKTL